jgi:N-acyl-phosphatidylethanolamine-hydrolysing phospholipase D
MLRIAGATILTDPVFEQRCSPVSFAGPKRVVPAPCSVASLPHIDVVCISHNHYDHLSSSTVDQLLQRFGHKLQWIVPMGVKSWLKSCGIASVVELDWWGFTTPATHPHLRVTCVPAQHWSNRTPLDKNKSLWCGWAVHDASALSAPASAPASPPTPEPLLPCFYFTGDTGWSPLLFAEIAATLCSVTLAALPIGAYEPRWMMAPQHTDPSEAVAIHTALRCRQSFGVHWGTWPLTDEAMDEPVTVLARQVAQAGLPPTSFVALRHGASGASNVAC